MPSTARLLRTALVGLTVVAVTWLSFVGLVGGGRPAIEEWMVLVYPNEDDVRVFDSMIVDGGTRGAGHLVRQISHDGGVPEAPRDLGMVFGVEVIDRGGHSVADLGQVGTGERALEVAYRYPEPWPLGEPVTFHLLGDGSLDATRLRVVLVGVRTTELRCAVEGGDSTCTVEPGAGYDELVVDGFPAGASLRVDLEASGWGVVPEHLPELDTFGLRPADTRSASVIAVLLFAAIGAVVGRPFGGARRTRARSVGDDDLSAGDTDPEPEDQTSVLDLGELPPELGLLQPWQAVRLREDGGADLIADAWFATMMAEGAFQPGSRRWSWARGPRFSAISDDWRRRLDQAMGDGEFVIGRPQRGALLLWESLRRELCSTTRPLGWWRLFGDRGQRWRRVLALAAAVLVVAGVMLAAIATRWSNDWLTAVGLVVGAPFVVSWASAKWLRSERSRAARELVRDLSSFRLQLTRGGPAAVEAAARTGSLARWSAWALALGCALQWDTAIRASSLSAEEQRAGAAPLWPALLSLQWARIRLGPGGPMFDPDGSVPPPYGPAGGSAQATVGTGWGGGGPM